LVVVVLERATFTVSVSCSVASGRLQGLAGFDRAALEGGAIDLAGRGN
jgi:hypothetical protein